MNLGQLLSTATMYIDTPIAIEVVRRDSNNVITHKAIVQIEHVKPNFDNHGVVIRIAEADIKFEPYP